MTTKITKTFVAKYQRQSQNAWICCCFSNMTMVKYICYILSYFISEKLSDCFRYLVWCDAPAF